MAARHLILLGLPGAGKSTVGRMAGQRLGADVVDLDRLVEARAGKSVERIFAEDGEAAFRTLESDLGAMVLAGKPVVLAPGGGFFMDPGRRSRALAAGLCIWLQVSPAVSARRLKGQPERPLLSGFEPMLRLRQLLEQREAIYREAPHRVSTDNRSPEQVADVIVELARKEGGW